MDDKARAEADLLGLQRLGHRLKLILELEAHEREARFDLARPGSELALDDQSARPYQVSHLVGHCLALSLDALLGAQFVLQDPADVNGVRLLMSAPFPLLRTAMEAGALAMWVLMPDARDQRLERLFRARWDDIVSDDNLALAFTEFRDSDSREDVAGKNRLRRENTKHVRRRKAALRGAMDATSITRAAVELGLPGFGPLMAQTAPSLGIDPNHAHGLWRTVSGLTHPSASRSILASSVEYQHSSEPGVSRAFLTARPSLLNSAVEAGLLLPWHVLRRVAQLGDNPAVEFVVPAGFPPPPPPRAA
ncbi:hypothetical protein [Amnibacterium endophyticum]|uniref:IrrE N-terminal-like domain-containing protein n=1 Tax=Amnibacterium endophyticum TaxID=2109337 RepID=A0ABW4LFL4_9MICO